MSKYKVGDKVKVREDLEIWKTYGSDVFIDDMAELKGKEVTIKSLCNHSDEYRIEEMNFTWTSDMFEGLAEEIKPNFKVGDKVELISVDGYDTPYGLKIGDRGVISTMYNSCYDACKVNFTNIEGKPICLDQIKLVKPNISMEEPTQSIPNKGTIKYIITDDGITYTTLNGSKKGKSVKSGKDKSSNKIGILIATARALGFNEDKISEIVDVLFDDDSNTKAKCENAVMKNDINRALSILDKYKE